MLLRNYYLFSLINVVFVFKNRTNSIIKDYLKTIFIILSFNYYYLNYNYISASEIDYSKLILSYFTLEPSNSFRSKKFYKFIILSGVFSLLHNSIYSA